MTDEDTDYIYAIGHPHGYVKIGRSKDPQHRLKNHQTSTPYELWIIVQIPVTDGEKIERELHEEFSNRHVRGEWFELLDEDYDLLVDMAKMIDSERQFNSVEEYRKQQAKHRAVLLG